MSFFLFIFSAFVRVRYIILLTKALIKVIFWLNQNIVKLY